MNAPISAAVSGTKLGDNLRSARSAARLSQQELAERAGVSQETIAKLEIGTSKRSRRLSEIAQALGISSEVLLSGAMSQRSLKAHSVPGQLAVAKQLLRFESPNVEWDDLGPADREQFLSQAREMIAAYNGALAG